VKARYWRFADFEQRKHTSGDWMGEPDKAQWPDPSTGLPCLAVRNRFGVWCGYVGVSPGHRYYQVTGHRSPGHQVHRLRNILAKLPKRPELHERIKSAYWAALDEAIGPDDAEQRLRQLVTGLEREYPSAAACLAEDLPALCVHLKYLPRLRKRFRSSNLLERSLEEVRRRTKVIGRFPGETSCLSLCWAVLDIFIAGARGLGLSDLEYRQVLQLRIDRADREDLAAQKTA
jgi:hypothetical protein